MSFNGIHLTPNAIKTFYGPPRPVQTTTLQVINIKLIETTGPASPDRYRLIVSDGTFFMQAMLATQLNDYVSSGSLGKHSIIRVSKYVCNAVGIKRILIVLTMDVLTPNNANVPKIGSPVSIDQEESKMQAAAAPQLHQQQVQAPVKQQSYPQADAPASVFTIKSLNPYQNRWTIKARVLAKGGIKRFRNAKGDGQLFSVTFSDESGEIRATGFGDAVTMFHDMLQVGQVYYISKCALKVANKQWSTVNNDYEMTFDSSSSISLVLPYNSVYRRQHASNQVQ